MPDLAEMEINQVNLQSGAWPPAEDEIVLEKYKFSKLKTAGETVQVELPSGKCVS